MISVGKAYGALGSDSSVETGSDTVEDSGMDPVSMTVSIAMVRRLNPRQRAKYTSTAGVDEVVSDEETPGWIALVSHVQVAGRASSSSMVDINWGMVVNASPCNDSHPAVE